MATFTRELGQSVIDRLKESDLWKKHLKNDCKKKCKESVFLAIRNDNVGFYHNGGRLFSFDKNGFKTNIKFAAVIDSKNTGDLTESELKNTGLISNFSENYEQIKKNCSLYSGDEDKGISKIYHKHSYLSGKDIVVLDIEVSFASSENAQDRIDILLYDTKSKTKTLKFVEAKHFSNSEIWSTSEPEVIEQIKRYKTQIASRREEIIEAYGNYITKINEIFGLKLPLPDKIEDEVTLLIFGFDQNQKDGRLTNLVFENEAYKGYKVYGKGGIDQIDLATLWKKNDIKK